MKKCVWLFLFPVLLWGQGQSIEGKWKTIDDRSGKERALVEVKLVDDKLYATIQQILEKGKENVRCSACKGELHNKPVKGMKIIDAFEWSENGYYKGSRLLDPEQGKFFKGRVWLDPKDPDKLNVRGYLAFLYRTQTWVRSD